MKEQNKSVELMPKQSGKLAYRTDGHNHEIIASEDIAKGITVAASAIFGFLAGYLATRNNNK